MREEEILRDIFFVCLTKNIEHFQRLFAQDGTEFKNHPLEAIIGLMYAYLNILVA